VSHLRIAILGSGPAGLSAGLWLKNLGLSPVILESQDTPGGMPNLNFLNNNWILGQPDITGQDLSRRFCSHALLAGVDIRLGVQAAMFIPAQSGEANLTFTDGTGIRCAALVIATGTRYRGREVLANALNEQATAASSQIICGPFAFLDIAAQTDKHVLIVGGGDNAYENARLLLDAGARVTLVSRSCTRAQQQMSMAVANRPDCEVYENSRVIALVEHKKTMLARICSPNGEFQTPVDRIHILAGYEPNTRFLSNFLPMEWQSILQIDSSGYLQVDAWGRTNIPEIYAIGDVCNPEFPCIISALAQGAKTAKAIERDLRKR
jgi:thioredoxin reductase